MIASMIEAPDVDARPIPHELLGVPCLRIVGRKNHGKTTLILRLVRELTRRGFRVGTIKHSRHVHDLDTPGTDSYRHRQSGAAPAAIVAGDLIGVFLPRDPGPDACEQLAPLYAGCDLVLIEGDLDGPGPKVEVWRAEIGSPCLANDRPDIALVVTDDPLPLGIPTVSPQQLDDLVERIGTLTFPAAAV